MINNRKIWGFIIIIIALILLIAIIYIGFFSKTPSTSIEPDDTAITGQLPGEPEINTTTSGDKPRNYQEYDISQEPEHKINENDLGKIAMAFGERFGSYSNQSNYDNFTDLKIFMTDSMKVWADKYVTELKKEPGDSSVYYGVSTKALTNEVVTFNEQRGEAEIIVTTQRRESTEKTENNKSYIQKITITMVKNNGEWLIDKAYWEQ